MSGAGASCRPGGLDGGWTASLLVAAVAIAVHLPALANRFVLDEHMLVEGNEAIRHPFDLGPIWLSSFWGDASFAPPYYRPLVTQSFALNFLLGGISPAGFHAVNLFLHAAAALLLHRAGRRLLPGVWPALVASLLFASHPLASEPVDAVYGRPDLLAALFALAALLAHLRAERGGAGWVRHLPAAGLYLLALLSKESAAPLPLLLLLLDAARSTGGGREAAWRKQAPAYVPLGGSLVLYVGLRVAALGGVASGQPIEFVHNPLVGAGLGVRLLTAPILLVKYLQLWLLPVNLSPDYSFNELPVVVSPLDPRFLYCVLLAAGFLALGVSLARRRHPAFLGWGFFTAFYLLIANALVPVGAMLAERFLYLPMAGLCLMTGAGVAPLLEAARSARGRRLAWIAPLAVVALLGAASFRRASAWRDDETVARAAIAATPGSAVGYVNLGVAILDGEGPEAERAKAALGLFLRAIEIYPDYASALYDAGVALSRQGRDGEAAQYLERVCKLQPSFKGASYSLGLAYFRLGRSDEAVALLAAAVRDWPEEAVFRSDYGVVLESLGQDAEAREQLLRALAMAGSQPPVVFNLALVEVKLGRFAEALPRIQSLLERNPADAGARTLLGRALDGLGDPPGALAALREALRIDPDYAEGWYRLALLQRRMGEPLAEESFRRASALGHPLHEGECLPPVIPQG